MIENVTEWLTSNVSYIKSAKVATLTDSNELVLILALDDRPLEMKQLAEDLVILYKSLALNFNDIFIDIFDVTFKIKDTESGCAVSVKGLHLYAYANFNINLDKFISGMEYVVVDPSKSKS